MAVYQCFLSCLADFGGVFGADTPGSGTRGHGEDGRSECKQSLSLNCQLGSGALCDSAGLRAQDKNVFDIVCNCVMFALLVSGGSASANI